MNERGQPFSAASINLLARPFSCVCVPKFVDVMVRRTDTGVELPYLPQATEEDRGAQPFKCTAGIGALAFVAAASSFRRAA